jgi:hypothetical protein
VTVDVELEARIAEAVAARREVIAELVRQHVDRALVELVDVEVDAALERLASSNGTPAAEVVSVTGVTPANEARELELCSRCHAEPKLPDRRLCRRCKTDDDAARARARRRERRTPAADDDGPRASPPD